MYSLRSASPTRLQAGSLSRVKAQSHRTLPVQQHQTMARIASLCQLESRLSSLACRCHLVRIRRHQEHLPWDPRFHQGLPWMLTRLLRLHQLLYPAAKLPRLHLSRWQVVLLHEVLQALAHQALGYPRVYLQQSLPELALQQS